MLGRKRMPTFLIVMIGAVVTQSLRADPILSDGLYRLHDHPDGGQYPPGYGLRLDGLDGRRRHRFTFDFDFLDSVTGESAGMFMDLRRTTTGEIHLFGSVFGGLNDPLNTDRYRPGSEYVGWWDVDFTYRVGVTSLERSDPSGADDGGDGGDDDIAVFGTGGKGSPNSGSITRRSDSTSFSLVDFAGWHTIGGESSTFRLGDENDDRGHRLDEFPLWPYTVSGWGWLNHTNPNKHRSASDWLFTVEPKPIPAPGASVLGLIGFGMVGWVRRRHTS